MSGKSVFIIVTLTSMIEKAKELGLEEGSNEIVSLCKLRESAAYLAPEIANGYWKKIFAYCSTRLCDEKYGALCDIFNDALTEYHETFKKN
jgi:hypothetical protein